MLEMSNSSLWVLTYMGTHNSGFSKFGRTLLYFETFILFSKILDS